MEMYGDFRTELLGHRRHILFQCETLCGMWSALFPTSSNASDEDFCAPMWDKASCIPPTRAGKHPKSRSCACSKMNLEQL